MPKCAVCKSEGTYVILEKPHVSQDGSSLILLKCRACKSVFLSQGHETDPVGIYDYYSQLSGLDKTLLYDPVTEKRYFGLLRCFEKIPAPGRDLLDVGCGNGHFIDAAIRSGWNARGIEISQPAVDICKKFGLPAEKLDLFSGELRPQSADVLTMFEVMEHVSDPAGYLKRSEILLRPGGILYFTTPNFNSLDRIFLGAKWHVIHYEHLNYFTPEAVKRIVGEMTGMQVYSIKTRNMSMELFSGPLKKSGRKPEKPEKLTYNVNNPLVNREQRLRTMAENNFILSSGKTLLNYFLSRFGCGSTMNVILRKQG